MSNLVMPIEILMPALSPTMTEGTLTKWHKAEGDTVKQGEIIAEIETDKATMDVEAMEAGTLGKILVQAGTEKVPINSVIGLILAKGENKSVLDMPKGFQETNLVSNDERQECTMKPRDRDETKEGFLKGKGYKIKPLPCAIHKPPPESKFISPLAKRIAKQNNVDISTIEGSGPRGRIVKSDVLSSTSVDVDQRSIPYDKVDIAKMRRAVATVAEENKRTVPHFYLSMNYDMSKLMDLRADINKTYEKETDSGRRVSVTDLIIKALAMAIAEVPEANVSWHSTYIARYRCVDVSVVVSVDNGVIIPVIREVETKSIFEISKEVENLVARARTGQIKAEELMGGSFTISNMGMYGIDSFTAILNAPQSLIFAIGATKKVPIVRDDKIVVGQVTNITISCDHRVIDGALVAIVANKIKEYIENPTRLLIPK